MRAALLFASALGFAGCGTTIINNIVEPAGDGGGSDASTSADGSSRDAAPLDSGGDPRSDAADGAAVSTFCDATLGAYAALVGKCCNATDKALAQGATLASRAAALTAACNDALTSAVVRGRVRVSASDSQACASAYAGAYSTMSRCAILQQIDPAVEPVPQCAAAIVGLGNNNALCSSDVECRDGLTCVGYTGGSDGTCRTPAGSGGACGSLRNDGSLGAIAIPLGSHPACAAGFYCDSTSTCRPQVGTGSACTRNDQCTAPSRCDGTGKCTGGTENALVAQGWPCHTTIDCVSGLWCDHTDNVSMDASAPLLAVGTCAGKNTSPQPCNTAEVGECNGLCSPSIKTCVAFCGAN
jgi:hypothetical protein